MNKWKEASSLIISAACKSASMTVLPGSRLARPDKCNFQLLALKKTQTTSTQIPPICVFPGGSLSLADSIKGWEQLFVTLGANLNALTNSLHHEDILKLPIFKRHEAFEEIPRWLSLRITAIRETFEECGLLLCKTKESSKILSNNQGEIDSNTSSHLMIEEIDSWRAKVLSDPYQFFVLCLHFNCYPDVENLIFWNNWLTPSHLSERYDAVFFLTKFGTPDLCKGTPDNMEIASTDWWTPEEFLSLANNRQIMLKLPQWYEIMSLKNMKNNGCFSEYSKLRAKNCARCMPVRMISSDGEISLLPGDAMYPRLDEMDLSNTPLIHKQQDTIESLRCDTMHRLEQSGTATVLLDTRPDCR